MAGQYKYLFGPVSSRRLGRSLGVDLVPVKTCSLDCVYCESGKTTMLTDDRKEYVDVDEVIAELSDCLMSEPELDYITFSGSGEPTLNSGIGKVIRYLKTEHPRYSIAVLTNSTLFGSQETCKDLRMSDLVIASLDAVSESAFRKINRPVKNITARAVVEGIKRFKKVFQGSLWLEIFIVPGVNDNNEEMLKIKDVIDAVRPDNIQLNTLDRPGTEDWVTPAGEDCLKKFLSILDVGEMIGSPQDHAGYSSSESNEKTLASDILNMIRRRPSTIEDFKVCFGQSQLAVEKALRKLKEDGLVAVEEKKRGVFFSLKR